MSGRFYVYTHKRPGTSRVFYVGKGNGLRAYAYDNRNQHWRNVVAKEGGRDVAIVCDGLNEELAFLLESEVIDLYRRTGHRLVNMTDGGEGVSGLRHSEEARRKMSESHRGKPLEEAHRANSARARIGTVCKPETREKLSARNRGQVMTQEQRAKLSAAKKGTTLSEEHKAKIAAAMKGRVISEKCRAVARARWEEYRAKKASA